MTQGNSPFGDETGVETYVPPKILLLNDDARFLNKISEGVQKAIFKLQTALDLSTGLLYACNEPYDAILVNYEMLQTKDDRIMFLEDMKGLPGYRNIPISVLLPIKIDEKREDVLKQQFSSVLVKTSDIKEISHHLLSMISGSYDRYSALVVSNHASTCQSLCDRLAKAGLDASSVKVLEQVIESIYRQQPDIVLIDYELKDDCAAISRQIRSSLRLEDKLIALFGEKINTIKDLQVADLAVSTKDSDAKMVSLLKNRASECKERNRSKSRDPLTSLPMRNKLFQHLIPRLHFKSSTEHQMEIFVIDIDSLKTINQKYGYAMGDEVIRRLSAYLQQTFTHQYVYHWDHDNFVIVNDVHDPNFYEKISRAQASFELLRFPGVEDPIRLKVGTAGYPKDSKTATGLISVALSRLALVPAGVR